MLGAQQVPLDGYPLKQLRRQNKSVNNAGQP
jgi:hypothetical protein